jgi:hypothetical protein
MPTPPSSNPVLGRLKDLVSEKPKGLEPDPLTTNILNSVRQEEQQNAEERHNRMKNEMKKLRTSANNKAAEKHWEEVGKHIEKLSEGGAEAFVEWATGMNRILAALSHLVSALHTSLYGDSTTHVPSWDKSETDSLKISPAVIYNVRLDENGALQTDLTVKKNYADGQVKTISGTPEQKRLFDAALRGWALENHLDIQPDPQNPQQNIVKDSSGTKLDAAAFNALKADPQKGLDVWLADRLALEVEETNNFRP